MVTVANIADNTIALPCEMCEGTSWTRKWMMPRVTSVNSLSNKNMYGPTGPVVKAPKGDPGTGTGT